MVTIVNHIYAAPGWQEIWIEQLAYVKRYQLAFDNWHCNVAGTRADLTSAARIAEKHGISFAGLHQSHPTAYEIPAIRLVQKHASERTLYFHMKGASMPTEITRMRHRWLMQHFVLRNWRDCVADLNSHDICGVNWRSDLPAIPHYSGTFFWATQSWLEKLPDIDDFCRSFATVPDLMPHHPRCGPEFWIGATKAKPKYKSYYCEAVEFGNHDANYLRTLPEFVARPAEISADMAKWKQEFGAALAERQSLSGTLRSLLLRAMPGGLRAQLSAMRRKMAERRHLP